MFLGVDVAEHVLSKVFENVERMPYGHSGFDFICNRGKKIDVKSSCLRVRNSQNRSDRWEFNTKFNDIADYFLCIAFDNREDLNPIFLWLIPGGMVQHLARIYISITTTNKWDQYQLNINDVIHVCNTIKFDTAKDS